MKKRMNDTEFRQKIEQLLDMRAEDKPSPPTPAWTLVRVSDKQRTPRLAGGGEGKPYMQETWVAVCACGWRGPETGAAWLADARLGLRDHRCGAA